MMIDFKNNVILAPMSKVTTLPFRLMCKKYGADIVYSEMVNCDAVIRENAKKRTFFLKKERPIGIQMMGSNLNVLEKALKKIESLNPDFIDINFGCPAYNVIRQGSGSALLDDLPYLEKIVSTLSSLTKLPFTCKMRITENDKKTIEIAKTIEKNGAYALTVHGRTQKQKYSGKADWEIIKKIKSEITIPVILNGDIKDGESAKQAFKTGCDSIMIGRYSIGNPFIFKEIKEYLKTGKVIKQSFDEKKKDFLEFLGLCKKHDYLHIGPIKMQAQYFTKSYFSPSVRKKIGELKTIEEIETFFLNTKLKVKNI